MDAINGLCHVLDGLYYGEVVAPSLTHLRLEVCQMESDDETSLGGSVWQHDRQARETMLNAKLHSTLDMSWDGEDELDETMLDAARKMPGFLNDEARSWDEVGQLITILLHGRLGSSPMQHGRCCLEVLEISKVFVIGHVELLKEFEARGGKLTIL